MEHDARHWLHHSSWLLKSIVTCRSFEAILPTPSVIIRESAKFEKRGSTLGRVRRLSHILSPQLLTIARVTPSLDWDDPDQWGSTRLQCRDDECVRVGWTKDLSVIKLCRDQNTVPAHSFSVKPHYQAIKVPPLFHMGKTGASVTADPAEEPHLRRFRRTNAGGCLKAVHTNDEGIWAGKQTARRSNGPNDEECEDARYC